MKRSRAKSRMGRPPFPAGQAKSRKVFFRAEPGLYEKLAAAAERQGKPVSTWIHDTLEVLLEGE
jgi:predicted HicB family RNase H-like nuclease